MLTPNLSFLDHSTLPLTPYVLRHWFRFLYFFTVSLKSTRVYGVRQAYLYGIVGIGTYLTYVKKLTKKKKSCY